MNINVLFVDDNVGMTRYLTLSIMQDYTFGFIVSDQCMPEMSSTKFQNKAHKTGFNQNNILWLLAVNASTEAVSV